MRQQITVIKPFSYSGRSRKVGETVDARSRDARILVAIGKAKLSSEMVSITAEMPVKIDPIKKEVKAEVDAAGDAWDESLHVSTKLKNADGTWRKRPGSRTSAE